MDFARPPGPNALFFLLFSHFFFSLPFSPLSVSPHRGENMVLVLHSRIGKRRQLQRDRVYGVFGAKRT